MELETSLASLRHYVTRIDGLAMRVAADPRADHYFATRVSADGFDTARQFGIALYFAARAVCPVVGRDLPAFPEAFDAAVLAALAQEVTQILAQVTAADVRGAQVAHEAGFAQVLQEPADYMIRFALPNMIFHYSMAYAALRAAGFAVGKADFDGIHAYPEGFSFT